MYCIKRFLLRSISQKVNRKLKLSRRTGKCFASWFGKSPNKQTETLSLPWSALSRPHIEAWLVFENNLVAISFLRIKFTFSPKTILTHSHQ